MSDPDPRPSPDRTRAMLLRARRRTRDQLDALSRDFEAFVAGAEYVNTDDEHDPEGATIAFERAQVVSLRREAQIRLASLDRALDRLEEGTYGTCGGCGGPIGAERLEALPGVEVCVECAAAGRGV